MSKDEDEAAARREARKHWPSRLIRLCEDDDGGELAFTINDRLEAIRQMSEADDTNTDETKAAD